MFNVNKMAIASPGTVPDYETGVLWTFHASPPGPGWEGFALHFPKCGGILYGWKKGISVAEAEMAAA